MARTEPMAMAGQPHSPSTSVIQPDVLLDEADGYPAAAGFGPEILSMSDSIRDPDLLAHEQDIRLECLKLAVADASDSEGAVTRARAYADFVLGESGGRGD